MTRPRKPGPATGGLPDAVVFDFDGVVVDSEPIHLAAFQQVLQTLGVQLTREDYYRHYLGYDDHDCLLVAARDAGVRLDEADIDHLTEAKTRLVQRAFTESVRPLPGAVELIRSARDAGVPLAICSGALRHEIEQASRTVGVLDCFRTIVSARDVSRGKPHPEGYRLALERLAESGSPPRPARSLVVEDSPAGIEAGKLAGMKVLAVATSYPAERLAQADRVVETLAGLTAADLGEVL